MEKIADTEEEWQELLRSKSEEFIRSREQWDFLVNGGNKPAIIAKLESHLTEISKQIVFSKDGLAHAEHRVGISLQDFLDLLTQFGIGPHLAQVCADKNNYIYNLPCLETVQ